MFCSECGTKNKPKSKFCENCGHKLKQKRVEDIIKKTTSKENKKKITIISAILFAILIIFIILNNLNSPKTVAKNYFKALTNNNIDEIYKYIDAEKSEFTTKEKLKEIYKDNEPIEIKKYKIVKNEKSQDGLTRTIDISYKEKENNEVNNLTILLEKTDKKRWLIFNKWKVVEKDTKIVKNYKIQALKDSQIEIDGIDISKYKNNTGNSEIDIYELPALFQTSYKIKATLPFGFAIEKDIYIDNNNKNYEINFDIDNISKSTKETLEKTIQKDLNNIYEKAINNITFDKFKSDFEYDKSDLSNLNKTYDKLLQSLKENTSKLKSITFTNIDIDDIKINENKNIYISVTADYDYSVTYKDILGKEQNHSSKSYWYINLTYDYNNNQFKLIDLNNLKTYFSRYF